MSAVQSFFNLKKDLLKFHLKFFSKFITTVNVAFYWTYNFVCSAFERSHGDCKFREKVLNLDLKALFNLGVRIWNKTTLTLQEKNIKITHIDSSTYSNTLIERVPERYLESIQTSIMELFCAFDR